MSLSCILVIQATNALSLHDGRLQFHNVKCTSCKNQSVRSSRYVLKHRSSYSIHFIFGRDR